MDDRHKFISTSQKELRQRTVGRVECGKVYESIDGLHLACGVVFSSFTRLLAGKNGEDGPSAGVTMATALVSLALDIPVRSVSFLLSRRGGWVSSLMKLAGLM